MSSLEYSLVSKFYGRRCAARSGLPYMHRATKRYSLVMYFRQWLERLEVSEERYIALAAEIYKCEEVGQ